jgi:putative phosphoesterase
MKLGVIADSHDNLPPLKRAVDFFNQEKVDFVLHAGDFIAPFSVKELQKLICDFKGVFGNNDGERKGLTQVSQGKINHPPLRIELENKKIILLHDIEQLDSQKEDFDLVIFGHTHRPQATREDRRVFLNPGECCGWLSGKSTLGIIELPSLASQIIEI